MSKKNKSVFGIYKTRAEVEKGVDALKANGFLSTDISVLLPDQSGSQEFAHTKGTKSPEGATTGAGTGVVVGGALGWLAGIGALAIPGVGPLIAAGPIVAAFAGAGLGSVIGGVSGALIGLGIPEYEAVRYEGQIKNGGMLLSVHSDTDELTKKAKHILESTGAMDIATSTESKPKTEYFSGKDKDKKEIHPEASMY